MTGDNVANGGYHKCHPKPKTIVELKETLQMIWNSLSRRPIYTELQTSLQSDQKACFKDKIDILNILSNCKLLTSRLFE